MVALSQRLDDILAMLEAGVGDPQRVIEEAISALRHARAEAQRMEEQLARIAYSDAFLAQFGIPGKKEERDIRMGADSILARGQFLSFSRVLYARFPNPMMLARVEMGKDHCIFLLAEEAMFDRDREANA